MLSSNSCQVEIALINHGDIYNLISSGIQKTSKQKKINKQNKKNKHHQ